MNLLDTARAFSQKIKAGSSTSIVFVHVPKCGGSSIYNAISKSMGLNYPDGHLDPVWSRNTVGEIYNLNEPEISPELQIFRHALLTNHLKDNKRFIAGHFTLNEALIQNLQQHHQVVTLLRKPDKRLFSHFKYWMMTRKLATSKDAVVKHWKDYLESDRAKFQANLYSVYFGESNYKNIGEESVALALKNLERLHLVGDLDSLTDFEAGLTAILGKKTTIGFANTSDKLMDDQDIRQLFKELYQENFQLIQKMVQTDTRIYDSFFNKIS